MCSEPACLRATAGRDALTFSLFGYRRRIETLLGSISSQFRFFQSLFEKGDLLLGETPFFFPLFGHVLMSAFHTQPVPVRLFQLRVNMCLQFSDCLLSCRVLGF